MLVDDVVLEIRLELVELVCELVLERVFKVVLVEIASEDDFEVDVAHFGVLVVFFSTSSALAQARKPQTSN